MQGKHVCVIDNTCEAYKLHPTFKSGRISPDEWMFRQQFCVHHVVCIYKSLSAHSVASANGEFLPDPELPDAFFTDVDTVRPEPGRWCNFTKRARIGRDMACRRNSSDLFCSNSEFGDYVQPTIQEPHY